MKTERDPRRWWILIVLCLSTLVLVIDNHVLVVAIPTLTEELGATAQQVQWIIDAYILVSAGLLLTSGSLSDRYGRRRVMLIGLVIFGAASLVAAASTSPAQLIAGRALMGVGSALVLPSTLSILITVFDDSERRKATSAWTAVAMIGTIGGPMAGGALISSFGWASVFLINVPIAVLAIVAALVLMPESRGPWRRPDPLGSILSMVAITALVWAIIDLPVDGLGHAATLTKFAVAVAGLLAFGLWQRRTPDPLIPLNLFRTRAFTGGSLTLLLLQIGVGGLSLIVTQYLQFVLGYTPFEAGLTLVPAALAVVATNAVSAALGSKIGNRALTVAGLLAVAAGFGLLSTLEPGDGLWKVMATLIAYGVGGGLAQPAVTALLLGAVPKPQAGVGSALNDTLQQAGGALGVAVLGSMLTGAYTAAMPDSAPEAARHSIGEALGLADTALAQIARNAFTTGMGVTAMASAGLILGAAVAAFFVLRSRTAAAPAVPEDPPLRAQSVK